MSTPNDAGGHLVAIVSVQSEIVASDTNALGVDGSEIAFGEGEVVDGIEEIGFSGPVVADKTVKLGA